VQGSGAVINLILDPILIFGLFGFRKLGVTGAAIATVGGQLVGMCIGFVLVTRVKELQLKPQGFRPSMRTILDIYRIGLPAIVAQSLVTVMTIGMNKILSLFSSTLVVVLGYYFRLQTFLFMPIYGLSNRMVPVIGFNFGARSRERIISTIGFALSLALGIMVPGIILMQVFPSGLLFFFHPAEDTLATGVSALRIVSLSFPLATVSIVFSSSFQAMGAPMLSLLVSLTRQLVVVLPATWLLALIDPALVWWSIPIADAVSAVLSLLLYRQMYRAKILELNNPEELSGGT
jgi:Na+-driven multidrug efflux pump